MSTFTRFIASGPGAFIVTVGLGIFMANLIKVPFTAQQDKDEKLSFIINAILPEVSLDERVRYPELTKVVPPPAPPILDRNSEQLPIEDFLGFDDWIPPFDPPKITMGDFTIVADQAGGPTVRIPPVMPTRAERSGHCDMIYDVNVDGAIFNVHTLSCSQSLFVRASVKSVLKWKYRPQINAGHAQG